MNLTNKYKLYIMEQLISTRDTCERNLRLFVLCNNASITKFTNVFGNYTSEDEDKTTLQNFAPAVEICTAFNKYLKEYKLMQKTIRLLSQLPNLFAGAKYKISMDAYHVNTKYFTITDTCIDAITIDINLNSKEIQQIHQNFNGSELTEDGDIANCNLLFSLLNKGTFNGHICLGLKASTKTLYLYEDNELSTYKLNDNLDIQLLARKINAYIQ